MPTKYPTSFFEIVVNCCLKAIGGAILCLWIGLWFIPGLLATIFFAQFMPTEAAASIGALVWACWLLFWSKAGKLPQTRVISNELDRVVKLCFRSHDARYFEEH